MGLEFHTIEQLFHQALDYSAGEDRDHFLRQNCPPQLLGELQALLDADAAQGERQPEALVPLPRCGPFVADQVVGSGGMGLVYLAHRADGQFEQKVALKLLRAMARTDAARQRFRIERQILAQLQHPNIAVLHDGGVTSEGEPYLAMEYVEGTPFDRYCDENRLNLSQRLGLFARVLDAVEYAHHNLIVHGDLKPSNILVTPGGVPKLLDFGTSRFVDQEVDTTSANALTPKYASPEQLRGERLTTASDVFGLGFILYELVAGASPYPAGSSILVMLERAVQETNPAEPWLAVTESSARSRATSMSHLRQTLKGDLSSIVLKALSHDPARRYHSVPDFAADLERFEQGRPVLARRQTLLYRSGKFVARHRLPLGVAALALAGLAVLGGYAYRQQVLKLEEARHAKALNTYLMRLFQSINPAYGGVWNMTADDLLDRAASQAEIMLSREPAARGTLQLTLAGNLLIRRPQLSVPMMEKAHRAAREAGDRGLETETLAHLAVIQGETGQCEAAMKSLAAAQTLLSKYRDRLSREWRISVALNQAETVISCGGDPRPVRSTILEAVRLARQIPDDSLDEVTPPRVIRLAAISWAADILGCQEGAALRSEGLVLARGSPYRILETGLLTSQAACLMEGGAAAAAAEPLERAAALAVEALGPESGLVHMVHGFLAFALAQTGHDERAVTEARVALDRPDCRIPVWCSIAQVEAMQALLTVGRISEAMPIATEIASWKSPGAITGLAGLFVAYTSIDQPGRADRYRDAASKFAPFVPANTPWRAKLEAALARRP